MACNSTAKVAYEYSEDMVMLIIFIMSIVGIYHHIKYEKSTAKSTPRSLYYVVITFYLITMIYGINGISYNECRDNFIKRLIHVIMVWLLGVFQMIFLIIVLFMRLYHSFKGSIFALSKSTITVFIIIYVLFILTDIAASISKLTNLVFAFVYLILSIYLSSLFIYKLYQINALCESITPPNFGDTQSHSTASMDSTSDKSQTDIDSMSTAKDDFLSIITKSTILATISIFTSFIQIILQTIVILTEHPTLYDIWYAVVMMDIITNFLCIYLSSIYTQKYYLCCCGVCDRFCKAKCSKYKKIKINIVNELSDFATKSNTKSDGNESPQSVDI